MSELVRDRSTVRARPEEVWAIIEDPSALRRVLPGVESLDADGPGRYIGVLATKLGFMTVRADAIATFHDAEPPRHLRLVLEGRPRGLAGTFRASVPFDLERTDDDTTAIDYSVDLTVTGRLASFGAPLLRDTLRRQIAELVANVDRETERRRSEA